MSGVISSCGRSPVKGEPARADRFQVMVSVDASELPADAPSGGATLDGDLRVPAVPSAVRRALRSCSCARTGKPSRECLTPPMWTASGTRNAARDWEHTRNRVSVHRLTAASTWAGEAFDVGFALDGLRR